MTIYEDLNKLISIKFVRACKSSNKSVCETMTDQHEFILIGCFRFSFSWGDLHLPPLKTMSHRLWRPCRTSMKTKQNLFGSKKWDETNCQNLCLV